MSDRRMHITGYVGDEPRDRVFQFIEAAARTGYFEDVIPVRRADGTIIAVAMYSTSDDGDALLRACGRLMRILGRDTEFLSPWEPTRLIPGRGGGILGEVVTDRGELAS